MIYSQTVYFLTNRQIILSLNVRKLILILSQSPRFVCTAVLNTKIFSLKYHKTEESSKSSGLWSWNQRIFPGKFVRQLVSYQNSCWISFYQLINWLIQKPQFVIPLPYDLNCISLLFSTLICEFSRKKRIIQCPI